MADVNRRSVLKASGAAVASLSLPSLLSKAKAADTLGPEALKSTLTPMGGLRAGNADGSIPAWTGELIPLPANYKAGELRPDPFAGERPLMTITGANMSKYQDRLTEGDKYLLKTYPDYRLPIYVTHRTAIAPQFVYDHTYRNAKTAQIAADGDSVSNAFAGVPFPIPKSGKEVVWNHILRWCGVTNYAASADWQVTASGQRVLRSLADTIDQRPYYMLDKESDWGGTYRMLMVVDKAPGYMEGQANLVRLSVDKDTRAWQYLVGERRTRLAPQLGFDTPIDITGGVLNWDEGDMWYGPLTQVNCRIVGKKEMYVPYNTHKAWRTPTSELLGNRHINTDALRYELHRVLVVEMTLRPGSRNVDARRVMYFDEDSWNILAMDIYSADNVLWKYHHNMPALCADIPALGGSVYFIGYDFRTGSYIAFGQSDGKAMYQPIPPKPVSFFTPGQLAAQAGGS